jgi:hypothetical protein
MMTRSTILLLAFFLATAPATRADEPKKMPATPEVDPFANDNFSPPVEKKTAEPAEEPRKKLTEQEIKALIDKLVSPNPKPITAEEDPKETPDFRLPKGFDREKQNGVYEACKELKSVGVKAFPFLIERWDDRRYCLTTSDLLSGYCQNRSVGKVCQKIIFDQIQPYGCLPSLGDVDPRGKPLRPSYPERFLSSKEDAKRWFEKHKDKSLVEIQLEVIDWVIEKENKQKKNYPDSERERLQEIRKEIMDSKKPLPRGNYYSEEIEI